MFVSEFHGSETVQLTVAAPDVFDLLVDVDRLPKWNAHIHHVIQQPGRPLAEGVEWVIQTRAMGARWPSRARALTIDRAGLPFEHRPCSDDGNPSYALWSWQVTSEPPGSTLTVTWAAHPRSFWRKLWLARLGGPYSQGGQSLAGRLGRLPAHRRTGRRRPHSLTFGEIHP
jgi:hypothetical protein